MDSNQYDVVIVGGGPAGLSAALQLGRARRHVLLAYAGPTRNAPAGVAHNVFTRDDTPPEELIRVAREQLATYDVTLREAYATDARRTERGFAVTLEGGDEVTSKKLLLATGVEDILPETPGFREHWGQGVYHCPYCHGWEVRDTPLALYGYGDDATALAGLLGGWSDDLILFTDGPAEVSDEDREHLERLGVPIRQERVARLEGGGGHLTAVVLEGGEAVPRHALFLKPPQRFRSDLAQQLGATISEAGTVEATQGGRTDVPGLFVAGDIAPGPQQVISAAASGSESALALNEDLLKEAFENGGR